MTDLRWAVAAAYIGTGTLAFLAARNAAMRDRRFWSAAAAVLIVMGIAKQLRLQEDLTGAARNALSAAGLYGRHEEAQILLAGLTGIAFLGLAALLMRWLNESAPSVKAAAWALAVLLAFVLVRAASFHAVDAWVMRETLGLRLGWWVELAGIAAIAAFAIGDLGARKRSL